MISKKEIGIQIKKYRERLGLTQQELGKLIGVTHTTINRIESGKQNVRLEILLRAADALKIPAYNLFSTKPLIEYIQIKDKYEITSIRPDDFEQIKLFSDPLSLGPGVEISEIPPSDYLPFLKKWLPRGYKSDPDRIVAFPTTGISMKPTIMPGSIVWVDRMDIQPKEGQIYVFWIERTNAVTIKRLIKISRGRYCIIDGDNRNEEDRKSEELKDFPMVIDCKEHEEADHPWPIRGRVIWVLNRFIEEPKK